MISNFIFGGDTGLTYEQLQRQRALAEQLAASGPQRISTVGEGINSAARSISAALINRRADKADQKNREAHGAEWDEALSGVGSLFGGGAPAVSSSNPAPSYTPPPVDPTDPTTNRFPIGQTGPAPEQEAYPIGEPVDYAADFDRSLAVTESGGDYGVVNSEGYTGKYQFGQDRLDDFNRATGSSVKLADFRANPSLQEQVQDWHVQDIDSHIRAKGLDKVIGQEVAGVPITLNGLRAMAHLGGKGGMEKFVSTGGRYNPADSNGTRLSDYARTHAGGSMPSGPAPEGFAINPQQPAPQQPQQLPPDNVVASLSPQPGGTMTDAAPQGMPPQAPQQPPVQMAQAQPQMPPQQPHGAPQGFQLQGSGMGRAFSEMQQAGQPMPGAPQPRPQQPQQPVTATQGQQGPNQAIVMQLMELASSPYASESQKAIAQMLMQQYQQQNDPLRQLQIQQARQELEQGNQRDTVTLGDRLIDRQSGEVIADYSQPERPDLTTTQREYEMARQQGYRGTFMDYKRDLAEAQRAQTNVTVNNAQNTPMPGLSKLGEGMTYLYDENGNVRLDDLGRPMAAPVPGTDAARDRQQEEQSAEEAARQRQKYADVVLTDIGRAKGNLTGGRNQPITGVMGAAAAHVAGSEAADTRALVETVKANIGFDRLQEMREASPTGGALGQVTERELATLQAVMGSLEFSQSKEQLLNNLTRLEDTYLDIVHGDGNWSRTEGGEIVLSGQPAARQVGEMPQAFISTVPAGEDPAELWEYMSEEDKAVFR